MKVLPMNFLKCMSEKDRKSLGVAGWLPEDMAKAWKARSERDLQRQVVNYLRLRNIEVLVHRTDKKTGATVGWPDLTMSVMVNGFPRAVAIEIKFGSGTCSREQNDIQQRLKSRPNAWDVRVITSFNEIVDMLREFGL